MSGTRQLEQHRAFLDAHLARTRSIGLGGYLFGTSVEVQSVPLTLGVAFGAEQLEREVTVLREELETMRLPEKAEKRDQQKRMGEL